MDYTTKHRRSYIYDFRLVWWKKIIIALLLVVIPGCGLVTREDSVSSPASETEPVHLTITYAMGDGAHHKGIQTIINDFKKSHLNVQISVVEHTQQAKGYADELSLLDAMGQFPDLLEMRDTQMFADAGLLAELPKSIAGLFDDIPKVNGTIYTAPLKAEVPQGIVYNKRLFREWGLSEPATYQQFLEVCKIIRNKGIYPLVVGGKDLWHMGFWTNHFMLDHVYSKDQEWNRKRTAGQVSWTDAGPKAAFHDMKLLWDEEYIVPGFMNIADHQTIDYLVSGKAVMMMSGPWMFSQLKQADPEFEIGFFPVPDRQGRIHIFGLPQPSGWAMSSLAAADPDKAKVIEQFLHFFYSNEEYPKYLQAVGGTPVTKEHEFIQSSELMQEVEQWLDNPDMVKLRGMEHYWGADEIPPGFRNAFYELVQATLSGNMSIDDALIGADRIWDE
ncbi:extracellular solute-binding protein [Paenibacillus sp. JNUCC31]|uniref:ABC transporter substrate-binding protein n=1 Tax=Paenibacillus sp. JNUCC-31 TaxID=2777983 RepID=UPI0017861F83|nr:extracellular solute-binding protein [Paenibacillus sp. JNUCC-31]QOS79399.1 extracellular solute-binding protein [Paenibacillus sp. JNUCC-31]